MGVYFAFSIPAYTLTINTLDLCSPNLGTTCVQPCSGLVRELLGNCAQIPWQKRTSPEQVMSQV